MRDTCTSIILRDHPLSTYADFPGFLDASYESKYTVSDSDCAIWMIEHRQIDPSADHLYRGAHKARVPLGVKA